MITVSTKKQIAINSADHIHPAGSVRDNNSSLHYIEDIRGYFNNKQISVLDLGCSGGQIIVDHISKGDIAIGLEGSDTVLSGAGAHNWAAYKEKNLFLCDITEDFSILDSDNLLKFDVIQMWDVLEHIPEDKLSCLFNNIKNHLKESGIFVGQISQQIDPIHHISNFSKDKWRDLFIGNGLSLSPYIFNNIPRPGLSEGAAGYEGFSFLSIKL